MSDFVLNGSAFGLLVLADELAQKGHNVTLVNPGGVWGGYFHGYGNGAEVFDAGSILFELTSFYDDGAQELASYDPKIPFDVGRFTPTVKRYLDSIGYELHEMPTPQTFVDGRWISDLVMANRHDGLSSLGTSAQEQIRDDLQAILSSSERSRLHASRKKSWDFSKVSLEEASIANHGRVFHEKFLESFSEKAFGRKTSEFIARFHRLAWLPIYYPETLKSWLETEPQPLSSPTLFHYPRAANTRSLVDLLLRRTKKHSNVAFATIPPLTGFQVHTRAPELETTRIAIACVTIKAQDVLRNVGLGFLCDRGIPAYRITNQMICAGSNAPEHLITLEFNRDYLGNVDFQRLAMESLVQLGIVASPTKVVTMQIQTPPRGRLIPHQKNYDLWKKHSETNTNEGAEIAFGGAAGFGNSSINDQIVHALQLGRVRL